MKILFVCLGNICRSPTAHGVMEYLLKKNNLNWVSVDSAGTAGYHIGKQPDPRTVEEALLHGYDLTHLRARQVSATDFQEFDYIFAMDESNLMNLNSIKPASSRAQVQLALDYSSLGYSDVPDPYYGGRDGFKDVLTVCETLCTDILNKVITKGAS